MIQLTEAEYKKLKDAERKLRALEANGVDNWEWYDYAMESMEKEDEDAKG